jgi:hypothetical protein
MDDELKSLFRHWHLIPNFLIAHLLILVQSKTKGAVRAKINVMKKSTQGLHRLYSQTSGDLSVKLYTKSN